jgi:Protein of unknown function (DUF4236)
MPMYGTDRDELVSKRLRLRKVSQQPLPRAQSAAMSLSMRSSLKAGPFRFNLSKSGIGMSTGVPGFRVGTGPRGNYVRVGTGSLAYFVSSTPTTRSRSKSAPRNAPMALANDVVMHNNAGTPVSALAAGAPEALPSQLSEAAQRLTTWPYAAAVAAICLFVVPIGDLVDLLLIPLTAWLYLRDRGRKTVVVFYEVEGTPGSSFEQVAAAVTGLGSAQRLWFIPTAGAVTTTRQYKVNSGAKSIVSRHTARVHTRGPRELAANIDVPTLSSGKRALYFLPDQVVVRDGKDFAGFRYPELRTSATPQRFIEAQPPPRDSQRVDTTWKYVNVKGGPDRRYKNNPRLPIMLYGRLIISGPHGLHLEWNCSTVPAAHGFAHSMTQAQRSIPARAQ